MGASMRANDFSTSGLKLEGPYENDRNLEARDCFKAVIREACGVEDVIIGHHIIYETRDTRPDGFTYEVVQEIPSADALIFDHVIAQKIWGDSWDVALRTLALTPPEARDALFISMFNARGKDHGTAN